MTRQNRLIELGFSKGVISHLNNYDMNSPLGYRCQPPVHYLNSPISQMAICPLWECGVIFTYYNEIRQIFEVCSLENIDEILSNYSTAQAVMAGLFIELYEDDLPELTLRSLAVELEFSNLELLMAEAQLNQGLGYLMWKSKYPGTSTG